MHRQRGSITLYVHIFDKLIATKIYISIVSDEIMKTLSLKGLSTLYIFLKPY